MFTNHSGIQKQTLNEKYNNILRKYACKDVLHAHMWRVITEKWGL